MNLRFPKYLVAIADLITLIESPTCFGNQMFPNTSYGQSKLASKTGLIYKTIGPKIQNKTYLHNYCSTIEAICGSL